MGRVKIAAFDLETDPFEFNKMPRAFAAGFTEVGEKDKVKIWWGEDCCSGLLDYIDYRSRQIKDRLCIYAHNGGKFDFFFLMRELRKRYGASGIKPRNIGSRIVQIVVGENKPIVYDGIKQTQFVPLFEFRDSFALIPKRLKDIGDKEDIKIWKLFLEQSSLNENDFREFRNEVTEKGWRWGDYLSPRAIFRFEIINYLRQDCVGLLNAVNDFVELYPRKLTLASTAFTILKQEFGVPNIKTTEAFDREYRKYYFAGRVQFFDLGRLGKRDGVTRFKMADINSAFPAAMLDEHFYCTNPDVSTKIPDDEFTRLRSFYHIKAESLGALPVRLNGIHFPRRVGEFYCSGWELFKGIELGLINILKVIKVTSPYKTETFRDYVEHYYELKRTAKNESERNYAKLFLNSCYGKFSQDSYKFRDLRVTEIWEKPNPTPVRMEDNSMLKVAWAKHYEDYASGLCYWSKPTNIEGQQKEVGFINVLTAASITGKVRATMLEALYRTKNPIYCDTDSIVGESVDNLPLSDKLGDWDIDGEFDELHVGGKKLYAFHRSDNDPKRKKNEWKTACKGVRLTPAQICRVAAGITESYQFDAPNYSPFSKPRFLTRKINRADKRKSSQVNLDDADLPNIIKEHF